MEETELQALAGLAEQMRGMAAALAAAEKALARVIGNNKNISNPIDDNQEKKKENAQKKETKNCGPAIDTRAYVDFFNKTLAEAGATVPHQCKLTKMRDAAIRARCREHGGHALVEAARKMAQSDFLNGRNSNSWTATIDWMLRPNNFTKIIEGNYDNDRTSNHNQPRGAAASPRRGWDAAPHADSDYDAGF